MTYIIRRQYGSKPWSYDYLLELTDDNSTLSGGKARALQFNSKHDAELVAREAYQRLITCRFGGAVGFYAEQV